MRVDGAQPFTGAEVSGLSGVTLLDAGQDYGVHSYICASDGISGAQVKRGSAATGKLHSHLSCNKDSDSQTRLQFKGNTAICRAMELGLKLTYTAIRRAILGQSDSRLL